MAADHREGGVLDCNAILEAREQGKLVIEPFNSDNLKGSSYDVTLGSHYYMEQTTSQRRAIARRLNVKRNPLVRQPFDKYEAAITWGALKTAQTVDQEGKLAILIPPGMTILAHTNEFIGDRGGHYTTMMKSRSSLGRNLAESCKCAGWGDPNYHSRWTMEITNTSPHTYLCLPVGKRIAQIVFLPLLKGEKREATKDKLLYRGKYQSESIDAQPISYEELLKTWDPTYMLPRLHEDKDVFQEPTNKEQ